MEFSYHLNADQPFTNVLSSNIAGLSAFSVFNSNIFLHMIGYNEEYLYNGGKNHRVPAELTR